MKTYNDIGECIKILGSVSDFIELAALNEDFDIDRNSLLGAAYTMNEAISSIVEHEERMSVVRKARQAAA
jgi:hypothetical protein